LKINRDWLINKLNDIKDQRMSFGNNEDVEVEDVNNLDTTELILLRDEVDNLGLDIRLMKSFIDQRLRGRLEGKAMRFGDRVFRGRNQSKMVPYDQDKVIEWLGDDWKMAVRPAFRTSAIRKIAEDRGENPNVVLESLFDRVEGTGLDVNALSRSPKFIQKLLSDDEKIVEIYTDKKEERENGR
tara:strand:+ start:1133 stop:1684 length:552 start_codon:yes stop_codon:yes gene_type:complete